MCYIILTDKTLVATYANDTVFLCTYVNLKIQSGQVQSNFFGWKRLGRKLSKIIWRMYASEETWKIPRRLDGKKLNMAETHLNKDKASGYKATQHVLDN